MRVGRTSSRPKSSSDSCSWPLTCGLGPPVSTVSGARQRAVAQRRRQVGERDATVGCRHPGRHRQRARFGRRGALPAEPPHQLGPGCGPEVEGAVGLEAPGQARRCRRRWPRTAGRRRAARDLAGSLPWQRRQPSPRSRASRPSRSGCPWPSSRCLPRRRPDPHRARTLRATSRSARRHSAPLRRRCCTLRRRAAGPRGSLAAWQPHVGRWHRWLVLPAWARRVGRSCQAAKSQLRRPCGIDAQLDHRSLERTRRAVTRRDSSDQTGSSTCSLRAASKGGPPMSAGAARETSREGNAEPREIGERGRPGDHQVATGACLDQLDGPVANEIDRRGDQQERHGRGQQAADAERRIADDRQPARLAAAAAAARGTRTGIGRPFASIGLFGAALAHAGVAVCRQCGIGHRVEVGARILCEALLMSMAEAGWAQPCRKLCHGRVREKSAMWQFSTSNVTRPRDAAAACMLEPLGRACDTAPAMIPRFDQANRSYLQYVQRLRKYTLRLGLGRGRRRAAVYQFRLAHRGAGPARPDRSGRHRADPDLHRRAAPGARSTSAA